MFRNHYTPRHFVNIPDRGTDLPALTGAASSAHTRRPPRTTAGQAGPDSDGILGEYRAATGAALIAFVKPVQGIGNKLYNQLDRPSGPKDF